MPITVDWDSDAKTAILQTLTSPVTVQDIAEAQDKVAALLDSADHPVPMITDVRGMATMPPGILTSAPELGHHRMVNHPYLGLTVVVIENAFLETVMAIFSRLYHKLNVVKTMEEARAL